mmetsp:Transcript_6641/g.13472  ORF Transcript_6641/g.13472 Transcript_6641/m.13472 type:complete len:239 (-) Transcript_6641:276-992(-)
MSSKPVHPHVGVTPVEALQGCKDGHTIEPKVFRNISSFVGVVAAYIHLCSPRDESDAVTPKGGWVDVVNHAEVLGTQNLVRSEWDNDAYVLEENCLVALGCLTPNAGRLVVIRVPETLEEGRREALAQAGWTEERDGYSPPLVVLANDTRLPRGVHVAYQRSIRCLRNDAGSERAINDLVDGERRDRGGVAVKGELALGKGILATIHRRTIRARSRRWGGVGGGFDLGSRSRSVRRRR